MTLNVVVKKNIKTQKLRCFGSSKFKDPKQILSNYANRWIIENAIKDLEESYFLDKTPGITPSLVNVHFLIVSICRTIFRMMQRDIGIFMINNDGSVKTLQSLLLRRLSMRVNICHQLIDPARDMRLVIRFELSKKGMENV